MKNYINTFEEFLNEDLNEGNSYALLNKFLEKTLSDEEKGYYWIFTNSVLDRKKLTGNINGGGHGKSSRSAVEADLKIDKTNIDKKIELLKKAIEEFNKENNSNLQFTHKLNNPKIETENYGGRTVYRSDSLVASVTIQ
jgi:hypothetical protein